jgi:ADP-dependent NAD(P)H-hydrate dehydratase
VGHLGLNTMIPMLPDNLPALSPRPRDAHKGVFGRVLICGGSQGMIGAPSLTANAALRSGAGLVTIAIPHAIQMAVATLCPCAMTLPLADEPSEALREFAQVSQSADVLAIGPGMGVGSAQEQIVRWALSQERPLVLDADGLNNLARIEGWPSLRRCPLVLTPHPGEFATLTRRTVAEIQSDRVAALQAAPFLNEKSVICVLKGAGTLVCDGERIYTNDTGNPGMATGGSGDVLTGMVAALLMQLDDPFGATCLAVRTHGRAGDLAADRLGQTSLIATDLIDELPNAFGKII